MLKEFGERVKKEIEIDSDFRNRAIRGLVGVTEDVEGTAYWAFNSVATDGAFFPIENFPIAAKTGTAEVRGKADSSLFAAITPAQDPDYVMVAILEEAGFGSAVAAPMTARVLEKVVEDRVPEALTTENRYAVSVSLPLCIDWYIWRESDSLKNLESFSDSEAEIFGPALSPDGTVKVRGIEINCEQVIETLLSPVDQLSIFSNME